MLSLYGGLFLFTHLTEVSVFIYLFLLSLYHKAVDI